MRPKIAADPNPLSEVFLDAAKELGYSTIDDFNGAVQEGAGWHELTIADGKRQSTAVAYLHPAIDRPNLTVHTDAHARRLTFDGKRCTGVEYERAGSVETATAEGEIAPGTANHAETSMLWRSDPSLDGPDMQFMFIHVPFHPPHLQAPPNSYTFGIATVPDSRG